MIRPVPGDGLLVVDVQNDFLPGGALAVAGGNTAVTALNRNLALFSQKGLPVYASRDWHPADHCSFLAQGGPWPPHCIAHTDGAAFPAALKLPPNTTVISKATARDRDAYSAFVGTGLDGRLRSESVSRLFVGGLATDYCVLNTVIDALDHHYKVTVLTDAISTVEANPGDADRAGDHAGTRRRSRRWNRCAARPRTTCGDCRRSWPRWTTTTFTLWRLRLHCSNRRTQSMQVDQGGVHGRHVAPGNCQNPFVNS